MDSETLQDTTSHTPLPLGSRFETSAVQFRASARGPYVCSVAKDRSKGRDQKRYPLTCQVCSAGFKSAHKEQKYCTRKCAYVAQSQRQSGEGNPGWKGGVSQFPYRYKLRQNERYPERVAARKAVANAIRSNKLARGCCEVCKQPEAHAHHDDYSKPLEVRWLCRKHHRQLHEALKLKEAA